ncbi:hypothetical protein HY78_02205 [Rhizorhabdus wittichii DC-6]|nr:hypothetical protein HY78_02205 [Rhizorhabdus wittichii DC-6]
MRGPPYVPFASFVARCRLSEHHWVVANTLDLDPEWGAIDLIEEVERAFAIKIADDEAEQCWTMGNLYDLICAHAPHWDEQIGACASSAIFYRFRRSLAPGDRTMSPRSPLQPAQGPVKGMFKALRDETGFRLPDPDTTIIGKIGGWMCLIGFIAGMVALLTGAWVMGGLACLLSR